MAAIVNVYEAKTHLSKLLERVNNGEEIILARRGKACARLVPLAPREGQRIGQLAGLTLGPQFFEPLPEEELAAWDGNRSDA
ncbi:MAG: type II toxin-antitoxin system prevent-host-death family antitoxin [Acidimicrobiaceae bacterium]|nr:type II toxin-antitoxin system prevent-host-death family antitoxin [Acidimicrobiaceae bacterium]MDE0605677.1 type II toxin-antitoxin system prevent-host-death family antitoxin [Acidimicrobiaceae bacterium]